MPCIVYLSAWKVRARQRTIHRSRTFIARRSVWEKRFNKCWLWRSKFQCASKHSHRSRVYIFHFSYSFGVCNGHLADIYRSLDRVVLFIVLLRLYLTHKPRAPSPSFHTFTFASHTLSLCHIPTENSAASIIYHTFRKLCLLRNVIFVHCLAWRMNRRLDRDKAWMHRLIN